MNNRLTISGVVINYIKQGTFRYVQQVMQEGLGIRYGDAFSAYIEAEAFYKPDGTQEVNEGDVIFYQQMVDLDDELEPASGVVDIGIFTVKKVIKSKKSYSFIAYDNLEKLNASYSEHLFDYKNSFPDYIQAILDQLVYFASNDLGVTIAISELDAYNLSTPMNQIMDYFYTDGISYKDILSYLAELSFQYLQCDYNGVVHFKRFSTASASGYWKNSDRYIIAPTDQVTYTGTALINGTSQTVTLFPVFYKQDGLSHESFAFKGTQDLLVKNIRGETWHSIDLLPKTVNNPYIIQKNPFIDKLTLTTQGKHDLFDWGFASVNSLSNRSITPVEVHLFPFRNPFNAGQILPHIEDASGNRFASIVMKLEQTDSEVILTCSGQEYYYTSASENYDNEENAQFLNVAVNDLYENKVEKSGDTMSGALTVQRDTAGSSGIVIDNLANKIGDTPAQASWVYVTFRDSQGNVIGRVRSGISTSGNPMISLLTENGGNTNALTLNAESGNNAIFLSKPASWLNALGLGTSGVLPVTIAQGGTGETTADGVKDAFDPFRNSVSIASGTNLNDLYIPGVYYSATSTVTGSLTNCPVSGSGFPLFVLMTDTPSSALSRRVQVIPIGQYIYVRRRDTNSWTSWYRFSGTAV